MPDWSYQTVFRPLLFRLTPWTARRLALGAMGRLSKLPLGTSIISLLGHMSPDRRLAVTFGETEFPTRVGFGGCIDLQLEATRALDQFGIGFLEVGAITVEPIAGAPIERDDSAERVLLHAPYENPGLEAAERAISQLKSPVLLRLSATAMKAGRFERDASTIIQRLGRRIAGITLELDGVEEPAPLVQNLEAQLRIFGYRLLLIAVPTDGARIPLDRWRGLIDQKLVDGFLIEGRTTDAAGRSVFGRSACSPIRPLVQELRSHLPEGMLIIAAGGIHEPRQALQLLEAGADLVRIDTGLVFSGPGLIKRCNEAILFGAQQRSSSPANEPQRIPRMAWFWTLLMGLAMVIGGMMAMVIAATRVVMPYDEAGLGLSRREIDAVNDQLLHFMQHDRMTLAGTMLAVGTLYTGLSLYGSRRGMHWAHMSIVASAFVGFASFFLFLGFGYFDPFHAFVTSVLLQPLLLSLLCDLPAPTHDIAPEMFNDRAWRCSQWGQLLFVLHGAALVVAGAVISTIGITSVFVTEDLEFLQTSAEQLTAAHPQLVPLVAHDRATFGGMLLACGVCVLLSALWGFRRGNRFLWWSLMIGGSVAYVAAIGVHWHVGYIDWKHLLPAYGGLTGLALGGMLSHDHLCPAEAFEES